MGLLNDFTRMPASLWLVYINVTLYALCYQMQAPVQPHLVKSLGKFRTNRSVCACSCLISLTLPGADKEMFSNLKSYFSMLQLVGSLISGPLIDTYGAKGLLLLNFLACVLCYGTTATADSLTWIYISFLPTLFQHGVLAARAYITVVTPNEQIPERLGYVGLFYGIGFVIGPALGGQLSSMDLRAAAWVATAGSALSIALIWLLLPNVVESSKPSAAGGSDRAPSKGLLENIASARRLLTHNKALQFVLSLKFLFAASMALIYSCFSLFLADTFELSPAQYGYLMSFAGVVGMVVQAFGVRAAREALTGFQVTALASLLLLVAFLGFAFSGSIAHIYMVMVPITVASTLMGAVNSAQQVAAAAEDRGTVVAVDMAMGSGVRIISPKVVSWLVAAYGWPSVGVLASLFMVVFLVLATQDGGLLDRLLLPPSPSPADDANAEKEGESKKDK